MLHKCMTHPNRQEVDGMMQITVAFDAMKGGENGNEAKLVYVKFSKEEARKAITEYIVMSVNPEKFNYVSKGKTVIFLKFIRNAYKVIVMSYFE